MDLHLLSYRLNINVLTVLTDPKWGSPTPTPIICCSDAVVSDFLPPHGLETTALAPLSMGFITS